MIDSPRGLPVKETIRVKGIRKSMSQTMKSSVDSSALSQVTREIDVTDLQDFRQTLLHGEGVEVSLNTLVMAAIARTLPNHPMLNAELIDREILVYDTVNLGMAVATPNGLVVAVLKNADKMSVQDLSKSIGELAQRARTGNLVIEDVEGGTFTASNLGMFGIDGGFPIPRSPEGAILLIGVARAKPFVFNGEIAIRQIAWFSLTFDHRFIDGATAAAFLDDVNKLVLSPESLMEVQ